MPLLDPEAPCLRHVFSARACRLRMGPRHYRHGTFTLEMAARSEESPLSDIAMKSVVDVVEACVVAEVSTHPSLAGSGIVGKPSFGSRASGSPDELHLSAVRRFTLHAHI